MRIASCSRPYRGFVIFGLVITLAMLSCTFRLRPIASIPTIDPGAKGETEALFMKLWTFADTNRTLFGHQDDLFFGVGWRDEPD